MGPTQALRSRNADQARLASADAVRPCDGDAIGSAIVWPERAGTRWQCGCGRRATAGRLRSERPGWRAAAFCTDATAHSIWVQPGIDRYLVSTPAESGTVRQFDPRAEIRELPPPVRSEFFSAPERNEARRRLRIALEQPCVLLMAGGWGLGPMDRTASELAGAGVDVLAVAGMNDAMRRRLEAVARAAAPGRVHAYGFTPDVPLLMAAADLVVTSAGQTSHEARVVGRRQVLLDIVPGHGRENLLLELARGGAMASRPDPSGVVAAVRACLDGALEEPLPWAVASVDEWRTRFSGALAGLWSDDVGERAAPPGEHPSDLPRKSASRLA